MDVQDPSNQVRGQIFSPGLKGLRVDAARYVWAEDYFEFLFETKTPLNPSGRDENLGILNKLELGLWELLVAFQQQMTDSGRQLLTRVALDTSVLRFESHADLFPWLPWPDRKIFVDTVSPFAELKRQFDLTSPLAGQRKEGLSLSLGVIRVVPKEVETIDVEKGGAIAMSRRDAEARGFELATFELISLAFEEGSLFATARVRRRILACAMAILGLGFIDDRISKVWGDIDKANVIASEVANTTKDQPALLYCGARLSYDELRKNTERSFDYNEKGLSDRDRACRIAAEQTGMAIALHTDLAVDGKLGPQTLAHEKQFGKVNHVPGTNQSPFFRGALSQVFKPPPDK